MLGTRAKVRIMIRFRVRATVTVSERLRDRGITMGVGFRGSVADAL